MATNLNKTKKLVSKIFSLRRVIKPAVPLKLRKIYFRHLPNSNKFFAFTQQYGRSLLGKRLLVLRLRRDGSLEIFAIASHHTATLWKSFIFPTVFIIVVLYDIQICHYFSALKHKSQGFFEKKFLAPLYYVLLWRLHSKNSYHFD